MADALSRIPIQLDDPSKDEEEEARAYAIHKIALAPRSQGPQKALNLETFSGLRLKKTQQDDVILVQVISWVRGSEYLPENRVMRGRHNHLKYYRSILPTISKNQTNPHIQLAPGSLQSMSKP